MSIFDFLLSRKKSSAASAKERLQIVMAHQRLGNNAPDFLPRLQNDILSVIRKYVNIETDQIDIRLDSKNECSTLEVNIEIPN